MERIYALMGLGPGDEGKGKIAGFLTDLLSGKLDPGKYNLSWRFQGGNNAGHTMISDDWSLQLSQIPSSISNPKTHCFMGTGMFVTVRTLYNEIVSLHKKGLKITPKNFGISSKAHVTLDYHVQDDQTAYNLTEHTSTGSGIKQTARDKMNRTGIRFVEFLDSYLMADILQNRVFKDRGIIKSVNYFKKMVDSYSKEREFLEEFVKLEHVVFKDPIYQFGVGEGAQGQVLCVDHGQYPGTSSSNPCFPTHRPDSTIGIIKAYNSSVGIGDRPFVAEMPESIQNKVREEWQEFGVRTGKPRHIGYMDLVALKYAADTAENDHLAITCLDRLESLGRYNEDLNIVKAYKINGKVYDEWDLSFDRRDTLFNAEPIYEPLKTWTKTVDEKGNLTDNAQFYIDYIEQNVGKQFSLIGVGPKNSDTIVVNSIL
jgi:adenylosuccinate synthase